MQNITLRMVFSLFVLIVNTLVFSGYMAYHYVTIKVEMTHELKNSADSISEWLTGALRMPLWSMDKKTTEDIIISGMNKQICGVIVTDEFENIFFGIKRNKDWQIIKSDEVNFQGNFIKAERDIFDKTTKLGKVEVYLTRKYMESQLTRSIKSMIIALVFINVIIFLLLYFFVQNVIVRPITTTVTWISRLSNGDIPEFVRNRYIGEFDRIIKSLNILIETSRETTHISNEIASGNISIDVVERSENDHLMHALKMMIQKLNAIMNETSGMIQSVREGKHNVHGDVEAFQGVWRDLIIGVNHLMDVRMQAMDALQASEERYRSLVEDQVELVSRFRPDGTSLYVNSGYCSYFGKVKENVIGTKWQPIVHPDDLPIIDGLLSRLCVEHPVVITENRVNDAKGEMRWVQFSNRAFFDNNLILQEIQSVGRDITDRKLAEEALRESEEIYRNLSSNIPGMIYRAKADWSTEIVSNCEMVCGYSVDEFKIQEINWTDLIHPNNKQLVFEEAAKLIDKPTSIVQEYKIIDKDGAIRWVSDHKSSLFNKNGSYIGVDGIVFDITNRKRMEEQLQQSQKMEAIGTLAGGIAHDFNNMLGVITGNTSYALSNLNKDDELYEILSDVQESSKQAQSLTHQLLTFSKGGAPIKKAAYINELIQKSVIFSIRGATASCSFELSDDLWPAEIDEGQINQVIGNIVINANQAMPNGGTITIRTENATLETKSNLPLSAGRYIKIVIEDQGLGISKKNLSNIFEPYFTTKQKGSGLGLATTYSIIKRHDGHINVYSEIEKGTVFNIYLPASTKDIRATEDKQESKHTGQGKILIMDDQEPILKMAGRMLNNMGYDTTLAIDGHQAIELYHEAYKAQKPFDLVILDLTIPGGMGGAKTVIELLKIDPNVKVVVSSGYSNDPIMANHEDYGFCGVVPKPYTKEQLSDLLKKLFGEKG